MPPRIQTPKGETSLKGLGPGGVVRRPKRRSRRRASGGEEPNAPPPAPAAKSVGGGGGGGAAAEGPVAASVAAPPKKQPEGAASPDMQAKSPPTEAGTETESAPAEPPESVEQKEQREAEAAAEQAKENPPPPPEPEPAEPKPKAEAGGESAPKGPEAGDLPTPVMAQDVTQLLTDESVTPEKIILAIAKMTQMSELEALIAMLKVVVFPRPGMKKVAADQAEGRKAQIQRPPIRKTSFALGDKKKVKLPGKKIAMTPAEYVPIWLDAADHDPKKWFSEFAANESFLGRKFNHPIHQSMANDLRGIERKFIEESPTGLTDPMEVGTELGLIKNQKLSGGREHPDRAAFSMHLVGLAMDVNYATNFFPAAPEAQKKNPKDETGSQAAVSNILELAEELDPTGTPTLRKVIFGGHKIGDIFTRRREASDRLVAFFALLEVDESNDRRIDRLLESAMGKEWTKIRTATTDPAERRQRVRATIKAQLDILVKMLKGRRKPASAEAALKTTGLFDLQQRFVEGMERGGAEWGGRFGDFMHFDMRGKPLGRTLHKLARRIRDELKKEAKLMPDTGGLDEFKKIVEAVSKK